MKCGAYWNMIDTVDLSIRVGPKYIKFSDQAPNWAKVVPWYGVQLNVKFFSEFVNFKNI